MLYTPNILGGITARNWDDQLYKKLNDFSVNHPVLGRVAAIPAAAANTILDLGNTLVELVTVIASVPIRALGMIFTKHKDCTFKLTVERLNRSLELICSLPWKIALVMPIQLFAQIAFGVWDPKKVTSMNVFNPVFNTRNFI